MSRRSVLPLFIGTLLLRSSSGATTVVLGLLFAQLASHSVRAITSLQVGLLPVAYFATELTLASFMGGLSDRLGRRFFLILGPLIGLIHCSLLFFTPMRNPLPYLLGMEVLAGISSAMIVPASLSYLADLTAQNQGYRMRIMSFYELVTSAGIAVGTVIGGFAWDHFGRGSFFLLAVLYVLISFCMALSPVVNQAVDRGRFRYTLARYWRLLRMPRLFIFIPAWLCINALLGIWLSSQLTFILASPVHRGHQVMMGSLSGLGGAHRLSLILGGFVLFFTLSLLFWAFFLNRVSRLYLMLTSIVGIYLACVALFGMNHRSPGNDTLLLVWLPVLLVGVFAETSFAPAALAYLADLSEEASKDRGLLMGLYSIFLGLGQIIGNGLGGVFAHSFGFDGLIYLTALLAGVALVTLLWLFSQEKERLA